MRSAAPATIGQREEEGKTGRRFPVEADEQCRGDGDAGPGNAGHQGQALGEADDHGGLQGDPVHLPPLRAGGVGKGEDEGEGDQEAGNEQGVGAEYLLDRFFQGLADDGGRNGRGDDVKGEPVCRGVEPLAGHRLAKLKQSSMMSRQK